MTTLRIKNVIIPFPTILPVYTCDRRPLPEIKPGVKLVPIKPDRSLGHVTCPWSWPLKTTDGITSEK
jgi:hypothetical protein